MSLSPANTHALDSRRQRPAFAVPLVVSGLVLVVFGAAFARYSPPLASLEVSPKQFDLGDVARGRTVRTAVTLTNRGNRTLHVASAMPGCGCTTLNAPKELPPGKSVPLTVTYDTEGPIGAVHKGLTLAFREAPDKPLRLAIVGNVREEIRVTPADLSLGELGGGDVSRFQFTATRVDKKPLMLRPDSVPAGVRVETRHTASAPHEVRVSGTLTAPLLPDDYSDTLRLDTDDDALPEIKVTLSYTVRPRFTVEPRIANFGVIASDAKPEMSLRIRGNAPIRLQNVPRGVRAKLTEPKSEGDSYTLTVSLTEQGEGRILSERLTLATDDLKQPHIVVPVYGLYRF